MKKRLFPADITLPEKEWLMDQAQILRLPLFANDPVFPCSSGPVFNVTSYVVAICGTDYCDISLVAVRKSPFPET